MDRTPADFWHEGVIGGEDACDDSPAFDYDEGSAQCREPSLEGPTGYLGHFANKEVLRQGHNDVPGMGMSGAATDAESVDEFVQNLYQGVAPGGSGQGNPL